MLRIAFLLACTTLLSACWGGYFQPPEADRTCPRPVVQDVLQTQRLLTQVQNGATTAKDLKIMPAPLRTATLVKTGEDALQLRLYRTGLPGCQWVNAPRMAEPVVLRDGVVMAHGMAEFDAMVAKGWRIREAEWPWYAYGFSYIPPR